MGVSFYDDDYRKKVEVLIEKIKMLNPRSSSERPSVAYLDAVKELDALQKNCRHHFKVILLFIRHRRFCDICHLEDFTFKTE